PVSITEAIIHSAGIGKVLFKPVLSGGAPGRLVEFSRVLHVPVLSRPLLSMTKLTLHHAYKIVMWKESIYFHHNGPLIFTAKVKGSLAHLVGTVIAQSSPPASPAVSALNTTAAPLDLILWHRRFSHLNYGALKSMISKGLVNGLKVQSQANPDPICEPCLAGNMRKIVNKTATHEKAPLELIHTD
ncbi:hypothetical protein M422DRAFT_122785, partial [Sphaerobolus stellatus SS14]